MENSDLISAEDYNEYVDVVAHAKSKGVECVLVFKPNMQYDKGTSESPDLIACTSSNPDVIASLLGNYNVNPIAVDVEESEESED